MATIHSTTVALPRALPGEAGKSVRTGKALSRDEGNPTTTAISGATLCWWRMHSAEVFRGVDAETIRTSLRTISTCSDPRWRDAVEGDVAATIGVAIRVCWRRENLGVSEDAALSALLACALEKNATAVFLLSAALDRRAKKYPECARLADSWLLASVSSPPVVPSG